jgi:hypothetical protein
MRTDWIWKKGVISAALAAFTIITALIVVSGFTSVHAMKPPIRAQLLQLSSTDIPFKTLSAATPSNVYYTVSSSDGPFCLEGFVVNPGPTVPIAPMQIGGVSIALTQIDDYGLSHPYITLVDGKSGGVSPLDIVLTYGNHICANHQIKFQATQWQSQSGTGVDIQLWGQAMILADRENTVTVQ